MAFRSGSERDTGKEMWNLKDVKVSGRNYVETVHHQDLAEKDYLSHQWNGVLIPIAYVAMMDKQTHKIQSIQTQIHNTQHR